jgi:branched-subunit amino acid transport protein
VSSTAVIVIVGLAIATFWTRAIGPVFLGGRELPGVLSRMVPLLAPALVAALIAVDTFGGSGKSLTIDARAAGIAIAALAFYRRAPVLVAVFGAIATTALVRLLT